MSQAEATVDMPSTLRTPTELRERRAVLAATRSADLRRRLRTGVAALLGTMLFAVGAAAAQDGGNGGASAKATAASSAEQVLSPGDTGADVRALQRKLRVRPVDGQYGPQTRRAVRRFQRRHGLPADGVAGPATLGALGVRVKAAVAGDVVPTLRRIAECESGGNPAAISPDGRFRGKYQFSRATWKAQGGKGDPAKAAEAEQDRVAAKLFKAEGAKPWPNCGVSSAKA